MSAARTQVVKAAIVMDPFCGPAHSARFVRRRSSIVVEHRGLRPDYREPRDERVLANFLGHDGRLRTIPSKLSKLLVVLDHLAQEFEPGRRYAESEVNEVLQRFHPDFAALRRYLVENDFMTREDSVYWRSGGTFEV